MMVSNKFDHIKLISLLAQPSDIHASTLDFYPWELLIRQARHGNVLSKIASILEESGILPGLPEKPKQHFLNAIKVAAAHERSARWEIHDIYKTLRPERIDFILLKGCAYIWTGKQAARGRLFSDTDILVRPGDIKKAERLLVHNGWVTTKLDEYDQLYYRKWMHEIPPLHHTGRHTTLDVHHSILPPIIKNRFDIEKLWEDAIEDATHPGLYTFSLRDMILHSATHLFHEGEFNNGFRDLSDLDSLFREYINHGNNWHDLISRAETLDLSRYLSYALNYCRTILKTPIPDELISQNIDNPNDSMLKKTLLDWLYLKALAPAHSSCKPANYDIAIFLLFVRSHWIKMPLHILVPHLLIKSRKRARE